ncbi:Ribosomal RNA large subunit methyltransferase H [Rubrobacter xylanophilus DSM 9941]|uniref:23S rRNA (pseudouridine(1915)-N(3))-methyltransferase RlmH n=1 Tax=Rubrobacter xylanophilus TaxID=49319 RepID=UPI001C63F22C|nr:23S rRNA (pseudouridine(1915)-N(3))-methyltransferase RlmH [Rubrobacter xylanophilus]QYJ14931.1 Ribosomal RNA large subunit methyltransferase H [Rubrobacter xylanophilus DSM 9941]
MIRRATIVAVGRLRGWAAEGCEDYLRRLRRYFPVEIIEVPEADMNRLGRREVLAVEAERLLRRLPEGAHVVALDRESGRPYTSEELARRRLEPLAASGRGHVAFVIGGALGLAPELLRRADERWSFGPVTLPHALARVVLLEQLYRAVKISRGEKYHW